MSEAALLVITDHAEAGWPRSAWEIAIPRRDGRHFGVFPAAMLPSG